MSLMRMLIEGPLVSLRGSPTVSPITEALWGSERFPYRTPSTIRLPASIYFLALSQAPPELENDIAIWTPETIDPARRPLTPLAPKRNPMTIGDRSTNRPGAHISLIEDFVEIIMHRS